MGRLARSVRHWAILPLVLGATDGLLTALTLAAEAMLHSADLGVGLAVRIGIAASTTATVTMFVADYSERRSRLLRGARELNLTDTRLMRTDLGRDVLRESLGATATAGLASLAGAAVPLLSAAVLPLPSWFAFAVAETLLGALGWALGAALHTRRARWCGAMLTLGVAMTVLGMVLHIA